MLSKKISLFLLSALLLSCSDTGNSELIEETKLYNFLAYQTEPYYNYFLVDESKSYFFNDDECYLLSILQKGNLVEVSQAEFYNKRSDSESEKLYFVTIHKDYRYGNKLYYFIIWNDYHSAAIVSEIKGSAWSNKSYTRYFNINEEDGKKFFDYARAQETIN